MRFCDPGNDMRPCCHDPGVRRWRFLRLFQHPVCFTEQLRDDHLSPLLPDIGKVFIRTVTKDSDKQLVSGDFIALPSMPRSRIVIRFITPP